MCGVRAGNCTDKLSGGFLSEMREPCSHFLLNT